MQPTCQPFHDRTAREPSAPDVGKNIFLIYCNIAILRTFRLLLSVLVAQQRFLRFVFFYESMAALCDDEHRAGLMLPTVMSLCSIPHFTCESRFVTHKRFLSISP